MSVGQSVRCDVCSLDAYFVFLNIGMSGLVFDLLSANSLTTILKSMSGSKMAASESFNVERVRYRVFIKYCVFFEYFKIFRTLFSLGVCVCTHTRQVEHQRYSRTCRVKKNHKCLMKNTIFNEHPVVTYKAP